MRMEITRISPYPDYDPSTLNYDFALLEMKDTVDFSEHPLIRPICLPLDNTKDYADYIATTSGK